MRRPRLHSEAGAVRTHEAFQKNIYTLVLTVSCHAHVLSVRNYVSKMAWWAVGRSCALSIDELTRYTRVRYHNHYIGPNHELRVIGQPLSAGCLEMWLTEKTPPYCLAHFINLRRKGARIKS